MSGKPCFVCGKTAYPLEQVQAGGKIYHNWCFKCKECNCKLNLKNFFFDQGTQASYCKNHIPKAKATAVTDSVAMVQAKNAPKKGNENIGHIQKGAGTEQHAGAAGYTQTQQYDTPVQQYQEAQPVQEEIHEEIVEEVVEEVYDEQY